MSNPHPSLILRMSIDERDHTDSLRDEIRRTYSYVAPSVVSTHEPQDDDLENILQYDIKLRMPYWDETDAQQQAVWEAGITKFLRNMIIKVDNTVRAANETYAERGRNPICYTWMEFKFADNARMAFKTGKICTLDARRVATIEEIRHLMVTGQLGQDIACVRVPSQASYQAQKKALLEGMAAKEQAQAKMDALVAEGAEVPTQLQEAAQAEFAGEVLIQVDDVALWERSIDSQKERKEARLKEKVAAAEQAAVGEDPTTQFEAAEEIPQQTIDEAVATAQVQDPQPADDGQVADLLEDAAETEPEPKENRYVNFDADDTVWGIEYLDGTIREYNTQTGCFVQ